MMMKKTNNGKILKLLKEKNEELARERAKFLKRETNIILNNNYLSYFNSL